MTSSELVERTIRRLGTPRTTELVSRLFVLIPSALRLLPMRVREQLGNTEAEVYRTSNTVTLTSGAGSLASLINSGDLIPSDIVKVTHPDAVTSENSEGKLQRVGSESALNGQRSTAYAYYAVEDNTLYTMMNNDRTTLSGDATVRSGFVPAIGSVKTQHEFLLVELHAELAGGISGKDVSVPRVA